MRTMLAALQDRTQYRPTPDSALMKWIVRYAAWVILRVRSNDAQSPFCRAVGGPYLGKVLELGFSVLARLPEVGKGSGNPAPNLADRWQERPPQTSIWSEQMWEVSTREAYDESPSTVGQKTTFEQLSRHHRNQSRRH